MKKISTLIAALFLFTLSSFAQKSMAYLDSKAPFTKGANSVSFQVVLDNINDNGERDAFVQKFKASKIANDVVVTPISGNKATYTVTVVKEHVFKSMETMLTYAGVENVKVDNQVIPVKGMTEVVRATYQRNQKGSNGSK